MLRIKVNGRDNEISYVRMDVSAMAFSDEEKTTVSAVCNSHRFTDGDTVRFSRVSLLDEFEDKRKVSVIDKNTFSFDAFEPYPLEYTDVVLESIPVGFDDNGNPISREAFVIYLTETKQFPTEKHFGDINAVILDDYYEHDESAYSKKCIGDILFYNGLIYSAVSLDDTMHYVFSNNPENSYNFRDVEVTYKNKSTGQNVTISGGLIPVNEAGDELIDRIYFFFKDNRVNGNLIDYSSEYAKYSYIKANAPSIELYVKDRRFYTENNEGLALNFIETEGVQESFIEREIGNYKITIPASENFSTETLVEEAYNNLVGEISEKNTPKPVDYEKRQFEPVIYEGENFNTFADNNFANVNDIVFNLHFREKHNTDNNEKVWVSDDTDGWNNYLIVKDEETDMSVLKAKNGLSLTDADKLSYMNFTDDDVFFQRNKLKKSFIRLSFYDSKDRSKQVLQYYSTIFFDSGEAFTKYVAARAINEDSALIGRVDDDQTYVSNDHETDGRKDLRLCTRFETHCNKDMRHSSDGFYAYLFPSLIEGTLPSTLYMKVEFNHAKYGRTIPMTLPSYKNDDSQIIPINPTNPQNGYFPIHYMKTDEEGGAYTHVDFQAALDDMYIPVKIKYDETKNRYVWFLPRNRIDDSEFFQEKEGQIIFNLFEPRLNGYENIPQDTRYDEEPTDEPSESKTFTLNVELSVESEIVGYFPSPCDVILKKDGVEVFNTPFTIILSSLNASTKKAYLNYKVEYPYDKSDMILSLEVTAKNVNRHASMSLSYTGKNGYVLLGEKRLEKNQVNTLSCNTTISNMLTTDNNDVINLSCNIWT